MAIVRVSRKTRGGVAGKDSRLDTVRETRAIDALKWPMAHNPYYKDVTVAPSRIPGIPVGSDIPGPMELNADWGFLPEDGGPDPEPNEVGDEASEAGYVTGGMLLSQR